MNVTPNSRPASKQTLALHGQAQISGNAVAKQLHDLHSLLLTRNSPPDLNATHLLFSDDFMGKLHIPLDPLKDKLWRRAWYPLTNEAGDLDNVPGRKRDGRGEIDVGLSWRYSDERALAAIEKDKETQRRVAAAADEDKDTATNRLTCYGRLARRADHICESSWFQQCVTLTILM